MRAEKLICQWYQVCPLKRFYEQGRIDKKWVKDYCWADYSRCVRYVMEARGEPHPDNMLPDGSIARELTYTFLRKGEYRMMPIGPLMKEHRLIERMIRLMAQRLTVMEEERKADLDFIGIAVDFIKNYADARHHGKEEDILFRKLREKELSPEHRRIIDELIQEHVMGRDRVKQLVGAKEEYRNGETRALEDMKNHMRTLVDFYPKHIEKEDKHFFLPCMDYFNDEEKAAMLKEEEEFDAGLAQPDYARVIEDLER